MTAGATTRRSLLIGAAVTVVGGIAGYVVASHSDAANPKPPASGANSYGPASGGGTSLTTVSSVPPGGGVIVDSADVVVTRDQAGAVHAFSATCTHQGCTVNDVSNGVINCPCHGSQFNADTGAVVNGPATQPLPPVQVSVRGDQIFTT